LKSLLLYFPYSHFNFEILFLYILSPLLQALTTTTRISMTRNAVWCLSNVCRGKNPPPAFAKVSPTWLGHEMTT
jgi:hypothetical protein